MAASDEGKAEQPKAKPGSKFRFVGLHAQDLASGSFVGPGDFVDLDQDEQDGNKELIDSGKLIPA
ncbi:MAG TPA: hypothetical protein VH593_22685 [Ktedonobacteraceae bacterium]|jgi:hypothetical protein